VVVVGTRLGSRAGPALARASGENCTARMSGRPCVHLKKVAGPNARAIPFDRLSGEGGCHAFNGRTKR
jgi:hypothetical protein